MIDEYDAWMGSKLPDYKEILEKGIAENKTDKQIIFDVVVGLEISADPFGKWWAGFKQKILDDIYGKSKPKAENWCVDVYNFFQNLPLGKEK